MNNLVTADEREYSVCTQLWKAFNPRCRHQGFRQVGLQDCH